ncbi:phosphatase PAP2 family protein [Paraburkholderia sp. Tr-20389]|uniref:phosphatase PAP2 family protein n=1 Tax=Paraburkholderia sp. Tr-20389 TaxID=2703903 RepID=UPI001980F3F0|nr:phosphatase PAP2 family protein [Paraburkholderia sp. Tr-20389]MBN3753596.1 phosphatase PAP2 family protein [Paraburkholderia sp. Tr-20389]
MWLAISNLGDAALTLPLAAVCIAWLTRSLTGSRVAFLWSVLLVGAMSLVGLSKVLYAGSGMQIEAISFRMISGHTMLASAVWPMSFLLTLHDGRANRRSAALYSGVAIATLIGVSRVFDEAHSVSEVIAGWTLGLLVTVLLMRQKPPLLPTRLRPFVAGSLLTVSAVAYGHHAPIQAAIDRYSPLLWAGFGKNNPTDACRACLKPR